MAFSVYDYGEFGKLLESLKLRYPGRKKPLSYEQLAEKIGYNSPRVFSMVINRQRMPSSQLVAKIAAALDLDSEQQSYLELLRTKAMLSHHDLSAHGVSQTIVKQAEAIERQYTLPQKMELEEFAQVSQWYYPVLKHLLNAKKSPGTLEWLAYKMKTTLSENEILSALSQMVAVGILVKKGERYAVTKAKQTVEVGNTIPSSAIKRHHAQAMQCAVNNLFTTPMEGREFQSLVIGVSSDQTEDAKRFIRTFMQSFRRKFGDEGTERVCRLNVQFFEHTDDGVI